MQYLQLSVDRAKTLRIVALFPTENAVNQLEYKRAQIYLT